MKSFRSFSATLVGVALLALLPLALAHGDEMDMDMNMDATAPVATSEASGDAPLNYFRLTEHSGLMLAHIVIMTISWVFVLPIGM